MLSVLSEIGCLRSLNRLGVYPDEFYTDLEGFKNHVVFLRDATVLVIFAGNCRFNKRHTIEFVKTLMKRAESELDEGIRQVHILSDITLYGVDEYYLYAGSLRSADFMRGESTQKVGVDIWKSLSRQFGDKSVEPDCHYSDFDVGNVRALVDTQRKRREAQKDPYEELIQVPDLAALLRR